MIPAKATPSVQRAYLSLPPVPCIDERLLQPMEFDNNFIGMGSFGSCAQLTYKDVFTVCVKRLKKDVPLHAVKSEAAILFALNSGEYTPHCFGVCTTQHAIVMSLVHVTGKPVTLWSLLYEKEKTNVSPSRLLCTNISL